MYTQHITADAFRGFTEKCQYKTLRNKIQRI